MESAEYVGKSYRIELNGCRHDYEVSWGIGYDSHTGYRFCWKGEGRVTRLSDGQSRIFEFQTTGINKHWSGSKFYATSFERNIFAIADKDPSHHQPVNHQDVTDFFQLVDIIVANLLEQIAKAKGIIPQVSIGPVDVEELRKLSLLPMPDGQFAMVELAME